MAIMTCGANWYVAHCLSLEIATQAPAVTEGLANRKEVLEFDFANGATGATRDLS